MPCPDWMVLNRNRVCMPVNQAMNPTAMNRPIFTLATGTPTARALTGLPPAEKIQFPTRVRSRIYVAMITNTIQYTTDVRMLTPPIVHDAENTCRAELNPCRVEMSGLETWLVIVWVSAMFSPWSMKNIPSVIRNDGIPVRITSHPLMNPITSDRASATSTPTHALVVNSYENSDAHSAELVTATPADRSNSPPIISSAIGVAISPYVDVTYSTEENDDAFRNGGAMM